MPSKGSGAIRRSAGATWGVDPLCYPTIRMSPTNLLDLLPGEIDALVESLGAERYRGAQITRWIYRQGVSDFARMTNLPRDLTQALRER